MQTQVIYNQFRITLKPATMEYDNGPSNQKATSAKLPAVKHERVAHPYENENTIRYMLTLDGQLQEFRRKLMQHFKNKGFHVEDMSLSESTIREGRAPGNYLDFNTRPALGSKDRDYYIIQSMHISPESQVSEPVTDVIASLYPAERFCEITLNKKFREFKAIQQMLLDARQEVPNQTKHNNMHVFRLQGKAQLASLLTGIADHFEAKGMPLYRESEAISDKRLIVSLSRESASPASNLQWSFSTGALPNESALCATATVRGNYISVALNDTHEDFAALRQIALQAKKSNLSDPDTAIEQRFSGAIRVQPLDNVEHTYPGREFNVLRQLRNADNLDKYMRKWIDRTKKKLDERPSLNEYVPPNDGTSYIDRYFDLLDKNPKKDAPSK